MWHFGEKILKIGKFFAELWAFEVGWYCEAAAPTAIAAAAMAAEKSPKYIPLSSLCSKDITYQKLPS